MSAPEESRIGGFHLLEPLGRPGTVSSYRAEALAAPGRPVVVKLLSPRLLEQPAALDRFRHDAAILARLQHPNLSRVLEVGQEGERPYVALEYVEGLPLDQRLRQGRLTLQEAFAAFRGICRGLAHAHEHGVVHRYLRPRDILVSPDLSVVKVADFGLGRVEALGTTGTMNTGAVVLGALPYLAPEMVETRGPGSLEPDHRADLYSAGVIFHEMLTGRPPSGRFTLPSQVNGELLPVVDVLVMKCLSRNPLQRYATALDLLADLDKVEEASRLRMLSEIRGITEAGSKLLGGSPGTGGKGRLGLWIGLLGLLLALAAAAFFLLR
jgi:serine/threonine protein kinase